MGCSLGHPGHSDENCKTKQWREFKAYQDTVKENKSMDAAKLTCEQPSNSVNEPDADVSYYDTAFSAKTTKLPTVMDTGASSHMFGGNQHSHCYGQLVHPTLLSLQKEDPFLQGNKDVSIWDLSSSKRCYIRVS